MSFIPEDYLILDVETTIKNKGNPFDQDNKLCYVGIHMNGESHLFNIGYDNEPYHEEVEKIRRLLSRAICVVGFNLKFDLHWLRHLVPSFHPLRVWDCQLFEFIRSNQNASYPSLDDACISYGIPGKTGDIATKYWDQGIDTPDIPEQELQDYLRNDLLITAELFKHQYGQFSGKRRTLFLLHCMDELVLQEMEYNGLKYDTTESIRLGGTVHEQREAILRELNGMVGGGAINWNSSDHLSVFLFGGFIKRDGTEIVSRVLKSGAIKKYERKCILHESFPARLDPKGIPETKPTVGLSDDELRRLNESRVGRGDQPFCRIYSVSEDVLRGIHTRDKVTKAVITLVLKLSQLKKLETTYYYGIPALISEMNWEKDTIHGTFNQCRAITGRTSSSKPNLQNFDGSIKPLFKSRYVD
jgi:DNA polymerase I-like protein with 3'-5' exonuclease and polymerase domains